MPFTLRCCTHQTGTNRHFAVILPPASATDCRSVMTVRSQQGYRVRPLLNHPTKDFIDARDGVCPADSPIKHARRKPVTTALICDLSIVNQMLSNTDNYLLTDSGNSD